jgi:GGDEF domain-containing protein
MMPSIEKKIDSSEEREALQVAMSLITNGIALYTIEFSAEQQKTFQETIRRLEKEMSEGRGERGPEIAAGAMVQAFEAHNREVRRQFLAETKKLRAGVILLTDFLQRTSQTRQRTSQSLGKIEKELRAASAAEEVGALKARLETCLVAALSEVTREIASSGSVRAKLESMTGGMVPAVATGEAGADPVTGLPGIEEGRACLEKARTAGTSVWAVALSLDRLPALMNRFGAPACETYVLAASQSIAQKMGNRDLIFQWGARGFLAVIERSGSAESVRDEMTKLSATQRPYTFTVGERQLLIPLSISFLCVPVWNAPDVDQVMRQIGAFVSKEAAK